MARPPASRFRVPASSWSSTMPRAKAAGDSGPNTPDRGQAGASIAAANQLLHQQRPCSPQGCDRPFPRHRAGAAMPTRSSADGMISAHHRSQTGRFATSGRSCRGDQVPRATPRDGRQAGGCPDNLARLDDIRAELGGRIVHLAAQAEVAERYRALHDAMPNARTCSG